MPIAEAQRKAIDEIIGVIISTAPGRGKRQIAGMFLELVDRESWPEYYEVIPQPRCLNGIKAKLEKNGYKSALDVYTDLYLVFLNALHYNEEGSQIANDAETLKNMLVTEWKKRTVLPTPQTTPPLTPQKSSKQQTSSQAKPQVHSASNTNKASPAIKASKAIPQAGSSQRTAASIALPSAHLSSDMDIDVEGGQSENEGEGDGDDVPSNVVRDAEGDEIVRQLERGLPRWEGFGGKGWIEDLKFERRLEIVQAIKSYKDIITNTRLATALDSMPEDTTAIKNLSFSFPLSLKLIEGKVRSSLYDASTEFDMDMMRLFEKGRRWYDIGSEQYGNVLLLQRLYQALTSSSPPHGPPFTSQTNFASIRAGPGTARPLNAGMDMDGVPGVTTFRVSMKDRQFVDQVDYKGWTVRLADWLHMANPDDPSRPIIGQVFKCWVSEEQSKKGLLGVTVCWYFRPEQTFHPSNRQFWENEVFKTGHFADHPLEDIIEKIACQFTARHIRGRPRPPFWYPGWPLYVCDSRYNDRERIFVRIKNWNSCVPEEVRKSTEFMPIYPFERTVFPRRFPSPFLQKPLKAPRNGKFPGGIGDAVERPDTDRIDSNGRKRARKQGAATTSSAGPSRGLFVGNSAMNNAPPPAAHSYTEVPVITTQRRAEDRSVVTAAGGTEGSNVLTAKLPPETARYFDRDPDTNEVLWFSGPPIDIARTSGPRYSLNYLHHLAMKRKAASQSQELSETTKRRQVLPPQTISESLNNLWAQHYEVE